MDELEIRTFVYVYQLQCSYFWTECFFNITFIFPTIQPYCVTTAFVYHSLLEINTYFHDFFFNFRQKSHNCKLQNPSIMHQKESGKSCKVWHSCPAYRATLERWFEPAHEVMVLFVLRTLTLQMRMCSHPVGLDVWYLVRPFVYFHTSCVRTAKALARLRRCAGSPEPSLVAYVISTIISWAGSFCFCTLVQHTTIWKWLNAWDTVAYSWRRLTYLMLAVI